MRGFWPGSTPQEPLTAWQMMDESKPYPQHNVSARPKALLEQQQTRIENFIGGYYAEYNLSALLEYDRVDSSEYIGLEVWSPGKGVFANLKDAMKAFEGGKGKVARKGERFGPTLTFNIPSHWSKYPQVLLEWDSSGESMIFDPSGHGIQGFTGVNTPDQRRAEYQIPSADFKSGKFVRYIEMSCNDLSGNRGIDPPDDNVYYQLVKADLFVPNHQARALKLDFETLLGLSTTLPPQSPLANLARVTANDIMNAFDLSNPEDSVNECREIAQKVLGKDWEGELEKAWRGVDDTGRLWALGHCHIDTAWLWPWAVTKKKIARSWSTQLDLMERYPEHRFVATSAQQYAWLEEYYPDIFERLRVQVEAGKFELVGATWLEHDANMPSGESFCRQFLCGQNYFLSRFGKRCDTFMLPDTFGYSGSLPQIARLSGCENFFTQKMSWNLQNPFPHTTFNWIGLDGSQILTHMTPVVNYNSPVSFSDILKGYRNHHNLDVTSEAMILFGNGDGGAGPTWEMLERLKRARAVGVENDPKGMELPLVKRGGSMGGFFDRVRKESGGGERLASWWGELYLEIHRGTYTSQARTKRGNRHSEILLRNLELFCTLASLTPSPSPNSRHTYPQSKITKCWESLLLCQFHDSLPGSSIAMAVRDYEGKFVELGEMARELIEEAWAVLCGSDVDATDKARQRRRLGVVNSLPGMERREIVEVGSASNVDHDRDHERRIGSGEFSKDAKKTLRVVKAEKGSLVGTLVEDHVGEVRVSESKWVYTMRNDTLQVTVEGGRLTSILDIQLERELLPKGPSAGFVIYEDHPNDWDAWDVDSFHLEKFEQLKFTSVEIEEKGPLRGVLKCEMQFGNSRGVVLITLDAIPASTMEGSRSLLRFDVDLDWQERHRFLKFELPTTIHSTEATYDAAFGVVKRATHRNTSWEAAKFEVCAHKFADLSEYNYGIALINESKYGYAVHGNVMRLSLLRSPLRPDPDCDRGKQAFSFVIYPHVGAYGESKVQEVAHAFGSPLTVRRMGDGSISAMALKIPFMLEGAENVMLETIKRAEGDFNDPTKGKDQHQEKTKAKSVVLRLFEHLGGRAVAKLYLRGIKVKKAYLVNILEDELEELEVGSDSEQAEFVKLEFRAFEIKTVKVVLS